MSESKVVFLDDHREVDPILGRGDLVRIVDLELAGIVVGVTAICGPDSEAPGQASAVDVAVPYEEEWVIHEDVPVNDLHRVINRDYQISRGVGFEED